MRDPQGPQRGGMGGMGGRMSLEACPHCHEQVHKTEDGCGTEKCIARRAFIRQAAIQLTCVAAAKTMGADVDVCWSSARHLWDRKPEGC